MEYVHAQSEVDCILQCLLQNKSCRSVNFRKSSANDRYENCELLNAVDSEESEFLYKNAQYDYYKLLQPNRVSASIISAILKTTPH